MLELREIFGYVILAISITCMIIGIIAFTSVVGQIELLKSQEIGYLGWTIYLFINLAGGL